MLLDIETAPLLIWSWKSYDTDAIEVERDGFILSCAVKWLGKKGKVLALPDYRGYKPYPAEPENEQLLLREIWRYLDEADLVLAHNGRAFDFKRINARFFKWGMPPPSPYETIDTLKQSRANFSFFSHRLNEIAKQRKLGEKVETGGWPLWKRCIFGDRKAWRKMCRYNLHDVILLERVYKEMLPWIKSHPAVSAKENCPRCGSHELHRRGIAVKKSTRYRKIQCQGCGGWLKANIKTGTIITA